MKWLLQEKDNPTGSCFFWGFFLVAGISSSLWLFNFLCLIYLMTYGALVEVHGGTCDRAMCLGDTYRRGKGIDICGCEMFWRGISYGCCSDKVRFNLFYEVFVSEAKFS